MLVFKQKKTDELVYLPLNNQAIICMGEPGNPSNKIFPIKEIVQTDVGVRLKK